MKIGFLGLLGLAFIVLKLMGIVNWAWIWVLCPIWGGAVLTIFILICLLVFAILGQKNRWL